MWASRCARRRRLRRIHPLLSLFARGGLRDARRPAPGKPRVEPLEFARLRRESGELRARGHAQLRVDARQVKLDGAVAEDELSCRLTVGEPGRDKPRPRQLLRRKAVTIEFDAGRWSSARRPPSRGHTGLGRERRRGDRTRSGRGAGARQLRADHRPDPTFAPTPAGSPLARMASAPNPTARARRRSTRLPPRLRRWRLPAGRAMS